MTTATIQNVEAAPAAKGTRPVQYGPCEYVSGTVFIFEPMVEFNPPRPPQDAKGSMTNKRLEELAERNQPPQKWFDAEEEQLF